MGLNLTAMLQIVREKLVSMELPFVQHTVVRGSPKRQLLVDKYGKFAVPYLEVCWPHQVSLDARKHRIRMR